MTSSVLVMVRKASDRSFAWEGGIDVRFATRALVPCGDHDVAFVALRIERRRQRRIPPTVASVVAQALVLLRANLIMKALPGTRQLWSDRLSGERVATLEQLVELAALGPQEASAVARALEYLLAYSTTRATAGDIGALLAALQRANARLVTLCIERPDSIATINAEAIEVATVARQIAAASKEAAA